MLDSENNLWVCTQDNGVFFMSVHNFLTYQTDEGLSHRNTYALLSCKDGRICMVKTFEQKRRVTGVCSGFSKLINHHDEVNHHRGDTRD